MMPTFKMPGYAAGDSEKLEEVGRNLASSFRNDLNATISLMANPAASIAAMSALGFGLASHAFGVWAGTVVGAAEASQRLFTPPPGGAGSPAKDAGPASTTAQALEFPAKPDLKVVPKAEPARRAAAPRAMAVETVIPASQAEPKVSPVKAAALSVALRKPASIEQPAAPDDLKAISGIGPKLETVLNDLGVWTYAQVAAWGKEETAWADDYLGFKGRIDRDGWIAQARSLSGAK